MADGADGGVGWFGYLTQSALICVTSKAAMGYLDYDLDDKTDLAVVAAENRAVADRYEPERRGRFHLHVWPKQRQSCDSGRLQR